MSEISKRNKTYRNKKKDKIYFSQKILKFKNEDTIAVNSQTHGQTLLLN